MSSDSDRDPTDAPESAGSAAVYDELVRNAFELAERADLEGGERRIDTDVLLDVVRHGPVLEALFSEPMDRRKIEEQLGVSRATSHRFTRWLTEHGLAEKRDGRFHLTGKGLSFAEGVLRFERNIETSARLAPLLDLICEDHMELVVEPFSDATVTTATPGDPYGPLRRFRELLDDSGTLRGFNTTHMVPLAEGSDAADVFEGVDTEIIYLPDVVETLFSAAPEHARKVVEAGHLTLRTREALPYGLAIFDDRVGIGGYDEETGAMAVFVDTGAAYAREWAERTYAAFRADSEPLDVDSNR
jgi:predicted transcriptional regulator